MFIVDSVPISDVLPAGDVANQLKIPSFSVDAIDKEISSVKKNFPVSGISNYIDLAIYLPN